MALGQDTTSFPQRRIPVELRVDSHEGAIGVSGLSVNVSLVDGWGWKDLNELDQSTGHGEVLIVYHDARARNRVGQNATGDFCTVHKEGANSDP